MKVKETSLQKTLEALHHDETLKEFELAIDLGDVAYEISDLKIDTKNRLVTVTPGEMILLFYEDEVCDDDEDGLLAGDYDE